VALMLRRRGISRVRPLAGGLQAWRQLSFPVESGTPRLLEAVAQPEPARTPGTDARPMSSEQ